jgi:2-polyprenyl-3-methyl-5-hydroxy-6-metoxy-1,4-benzoquinol methylase
MASSYSDRAYLAANPTWHVEDSAWKAGQILKMLGRHELRPRTIAEIGCGAGGILSHLHAALPPEVTLDGYDVSPQAIALAATRQRERLTFHRGDFLSLPVHVDLLLGLDVVEHVPDYLGFLSALRDKAAHHMFHIPLDLNVQMVLRAGRIMTTRIQSGHLHYFSKETALAALADSGYEIVDHFYTAGAVELPGRSWLAKWPRALAFALHQDVAVRWMGGFSLLALARPAT